MTKAELLRFLEPFTDDIEIFVNTSARVANLEPIDSALYFYRANTGIGEAWLNLRSLEKT